MPTWGDGVYLLPTGRRGARVAVGEYLAFVPIGARENLIDQLLPREFP